MPKFQAVSQLEATKSTIQDLLADIFGHQQHILTFADALAPLRVRQLILKSRLEGAEADHGVAETRSALASHFLSTK
jgi:hypothetical protein